MQTLPVRMWNTLRNDLSPVIAAVSTLLILVTIAILAVVMLVQKKRAR
jgi:putative spermidine/putrescine transport system permease protein